MSIVIDAYGHRKDNVGFKKKLLRPAEFVEIGDKTYLRFTLNDKCPVWCFDATEGTLLWAVGAWENKESLEYDLDTNSIREIDEDDIDWS